MSKEIVKTLPLGSMRANCYLLIAKNGDQCVVIDPGDEADTVIKEIRTKKLKPVAILLTHGHFDHIMAVPAVKEAFQIPVLASEEEKPMLADPSLNMTEDIRKTLSLVPDRTFGDGEVLHLAGYEIRVIACPGHSKGSCCFYLPSERILFSGDMLFRGSVGRTDFPGGSTKEMVKSLHRLLDLIPDETLVYPGHEGETQIGFEKEYNPFV